MSRKSKSRRIRPGELPAKFTAFFDGCCEPRNPGGTAGYGAVIMSGTERIWEGSGLIPAAPTTSNNVAEYAAFNLILDELIERGETAERIIVFGDSKLVIEQMFGTWRIKGGHYVPFARSVKEKLKQFKNIAGFWIPRDENSIADDLSKAHLRQAGIEFRIQPE